MFLGLLCGLFLIFSFQIVIQKSSYFQAFAQCLDPANPRADYLVTSEQQGATNRFGSRIGTCIIDPKAVIGDFRQSSYQQLYEEFFERSKLPASQKVTLTTAPNSPYTMTTNTPLTNNFIYRVPENLVIEDVPTVNVTNPIPTAVVFVEKDLIINEINFNYGDNTHGIVFIVKGGVFFNPAVTQFDGVIIAQGGSYNFSICTAAPAYPVCPASAVKVGVNALIINGSLISLDKPIYFTRRLQLNTVNAAEQINHQVKYLAILNNLLARTTNIVSEGTTYATCSSATNKPVGCSCQVTADCNSNRCIAVTGGNGLKTCQPSDITQSQGNVPVPTTPPPTPTPMPTFPPVAPRLVAHWTMDEQSGSVARDLIGGNTGTTPGSGISVGRFGLARDLYNGSFITVNNSPAFQSQYMTVSAWVYPKDVTSLPYASIFNRRNAQNQYSFIMELDGTGGINCNAVGTNANSGATKLAVRAWNHVVCTYDGTTIRTYISKPPAAAITQAGTRAVTGVLSNPVNPSIQIGRNIATNHTFIGYLDDIKVYSYALNTTDITALYTATPTPGTMPSNAWENPLKIFTEKLIPTLIGI